MRRYVLAGILTAATATLAQAQAPLPVIGWSVSTGHSATGGPICTLSGDFGNHSDLAWVQDVTSPSPHFTLVFDDGGAPPRSQMSVSALTFVTPGSPPLSIPGAVRFGQFKTTVDRQTFEPFLHLFMRKRRMTVALQGEPPVTVNLNGSHNAARYMRRCEAAATMPQAPKAHLQLAAATRHHAPARAPMAAQAAFRPLVAIAAPLPGPPPAAPPLPEPAPAVAPVALKPPMPAQPPLPAPAPVIAPAVVKPPVAAETPLPVAAPALAAEMDRKEALMLGKIIEDQFLGILQDGRASFENTSDSDLSAGARATRATDLCILLGDEKQAIDWTGSISDLSTNSQGGAVLVVKLADGVTVGTMDSRLQDVKDIPTIDPASDLFKTIDKMHVGERVVFSGHFLASDADCIKESSLTPSGAMSAPNFAMTFSGVEAAQ